MRASFGCIRSIARQRTARSACIWMQQKLTLPSTSRSACIWMQQRRYTTFSEKISESDQNCVYRENIQTFK
ncbi:hypothetical protein Hanom_Chr00s026799g01766501 [Helianthus anomalus]